MIGKTVLHYQITAKLGQGGMGEVYRATDQKLGRDVALKVLPAEMASSPERLERFRREAKALAALDHPGIVSVFSVEEADGVHFLTMQLVDGQSLDQIMSVAGLSLETLLDYATALADALAAAHDKGIVHRDLKPGNIIISEGGRLKVLDFGLAKITAPQDEKLADSGVPTEVKTREGVVMGTVPYMSPEQLSGRTVDYRSDIFSLGILLYEMAAGRRPFEGSSSIELASSILRDTPLPLTGVRTDLPAELERIVSRCLEKDARERFQAARDVQDGLTALRREIDSGVGRSAGSDSQVVSERRPPTSIAVLPFSDMSPARDQDWFCEGIAEEILNALTRLPGLRVATRTSAFRFKDQARDMGKIGEELGVTTLLEGSVRTAGSRLRVTAQLVNVSDGYQLWSERFDRQMEDVFAIQDEIAVSIATALRGKLVASDRPDPGRRHTKDVEAYHLYLKGRHNWYKREAGSLSKAAGFFEKAVKKDPSYVLAHAAVVESYCSLGVYGMRPEIVRSRASAAMEKALAFEEDWPEVQAALGLKRHYLDWDWEGAEAAYRRALGLNPKAVLPYCWYGYLLSALGRHEESVPMVDRACELDPLSPFVHSARGLVLFAAGRIEDALAAANEALEIERDFSLALYPFSMACLKLGRSDEAMKASERVAVLSGRGSTELGWLGFAHAVGGTPETARELLTELANRAEREYVSAGPFAWILSALGRMDQAFDYLDKTLEERNPHLVFNMVSPYNCLRSDPRFDELLRKMKLRS